MKHARQDYAQIQDPTGKIPEDEPVFLIRAQDQVGPAAVLCWANLAEKAGASPEVFIEAKIQAGKMHEWQETHKVKVPDLPHLPMFTVGARVKIVRILDNMTNKELIGTVGTVQEIDPLANGAFNYDVNGHYMHEEELEAVISGKCTICGEGDVVQTEEKNHETMVVGQKMIIPVAIVGTCNKCGQVNYALRKDVVEEEGKVE